MSLSSKSFKLFFFSDSTHVQCCFFLCTLSCLQEKNHGPRRAEGRRRTVQLWDVRLLPVLHWWCCLCSVFLVFSSNCWRGVKGGDSSNLNEMTDSSYPRPKPPTPPHGTSQSAKQDAPALPGSALKTLNSWLLKECIVLLERLAGLEGNAEALFCLCCCRSTAPTGVLDSSFQVFTSLPQVDDCEAVFTSNSVINAAMSNF